MPEGDDTFLGLALMDTPLTIGGHVGYRHRPETFPMLAFPAFASLAPGTFVDVDWPLFQQLTDELADGNDHISPKLAYVYEQLTGDRPLATCDAGDICSVDAHGTIFHATEQTLCRSVYFYRCLKEFDMHPDRSVPLLVPFSSGAFERILSYLRNPRTCHPDTLCGIKYFGPLDGDDPMTVSHVSHDNPKVSSRPAPLVPLSDMMTYFYYREKKTTDNNMLFHEWVPVCTDRHAVYTVDVAGTDQLMDLIMMASPLELISVNQITIVANGHLLLDVSGRVLYAQQYSRDIYINISRRAPSVRSTNCFSLFIPYGKKMYTRHMYDGSTSVVVTLTYANAHYQPITCVSETISMVLESERLRCGPSHRPWQMEGVGIVEGRYLVDESEDQINENGHIVDQHETTIQIPTTRWAGLQAVALGVVFVPHGSLSPFMGNPWLRGTQRPFRLTFAERFGMTGKLTDHLANHQSDGRGIITMPLTYGNTTVNIVGTESCTVTVPCSGMVHVYCVARLTMDDDPPNTVLFATSTPDPDRYLTPRQLRMRPWPDARAEAAQQPATPGE